MTICKGSLHCQRAAHRVNGFSSFGVQAIIEAEARTAKGRQGRGSHPSRCLVGGCALRWVAGKLAGKQTFLHVDARGKGP